MHRPCQASQAPTWLSACYPHSPPTISCPNVCLLPTLASHNFLPGCLPATHSTLLRSPSFLCHVRPRNCTRSQLEPFASSPCFFSRRIGCDRGQSWSDRATRTAGERENEENGLLDCLFFLICVFFCYAASWWFCSPSVRLGHDGADCPSSWRFGIVWRVVCRIGGCSGKPVERRVRGGRLGVSQVYLTAARNGLPKLIVENSSGLKRVFLGGAKFSWVGSCCRFTWHGVVRCGGAVR